MGEKNMYKKFKLFDKEGFYIILFVCLCIVAVTAVYMSKSNADRQQSLAANTGKQQTTVKSTDPLLTLNGEEGRTVQTSKQPVKSIEDVTKENAKNGSKAVAQQKKEEPNTSKTKTSSISVKAIAKAPTSEAFKLVLPVNGKVVKHFDNKELQLSKAIGQWETHEGIDISCELGSEIKAASAGEVTDVVVEAEKLSQNSKNGYGAKIAIEHDNGYRTVYSNLAVESVKLKKGDQVKSGDVIGTAGDTSQREAISLEGSHIHFELLKKEGNGFVSLNPEQFLK